MYTSGLSKAAKTIFLLLGFFSPTSLIIYFGKHICQTNSLQLANIFWKAYLSYKFTATCVLLSKIRALQTADQISPFTINSLLQRFFLSWACSNPCSSHCISSVIFPVDSLCIILSSPRSIFQLNITKKQHSVNCYPFGVAWSESKSGVLKVPHLIPKQNMRPLQTKRGRGSEMSLFWPISRKAPLHTQYIPKIYISSEFVSSLSSKLLG